MEDTPFLDLFGYCGFRTGMKLAQPVNDPFPGQAPVQKQSNSHAYAGIDDAAEGIAYVGIHRSVEQQDAKHNAAGLHSAGPLKGKAHQNQRDNADKKEQKQWKMDAAFRIEHNVQAKQRHAQHTADQRAEKAVSAIAPGVFHIVADAENGSDAGKGGVAVDNEIDQRNKGSRQCGFDVSLPNVQMEGGILAGHRIRFLPLQWSVFLKNRSLL